MPNPENRRLIRHFLRAYPARTAAMVALLLLAGLAEGIGVATLLPALEIASGAGSPGESAFSRMAVRALGWVGIPPTLPAMLSMIVAAITLKNAFRWLAMREVARAVTEVAGDLRRRLVRAIMAAKWRYFTDRPVGQFATALSLEAFHASYAYRRACGVLAAGIQLAAYAVVALLVSWRLALLALVGGVAISAVLRRFVRISRRRGREYNAAHRRVGALVTDVVQGVKAIKAMGREPPFLALIEEEVHGLGDTERRLVLADEALRSSHEPILTAAIAAGLYVTVAIGGLPLAVLIVMVFLFHRVVGRFHAIQTEYQSMATLESAFWSIETQTRGAEAEAEPASGRLAPPPLDDAIVFDGVRFGHGGEEVLRGIDAHIPAGRLVAVVGRSGAGKTTFADLLLGLHRPAAGEIFVDGVALSGIDMPAWRRRVGYIPQETLLLHDTVARNVGLGDADADRARIEAALRDAGAAHFVARMPGGLDAVVGERGTKISGGERQRLAIARALVARPTLLILDEATAGLDAETETAILRTLRGLRGRVTIVAVSHHAAVADAADVVFELEAGRATRRADRVPAT